MTELNVDEERALIDHLRDDPAAMEEHIRAGGTYASYLTQWKADRDAAARAKEPLPELVAQVLDCPQDEYGSVRGYLVEILEAFWLGNADAKYGITGSSDWRYVVYGALNRAGIIPGWREGYGIGYHADGSKHPDDVIRADRLIVAAIRSLDQVATRGS